MLSKILGIGTTKRNWKQVKAVKSDQWVNTSIDRARKQVLIYAQYQQTSAQAQISKLLMAGKLWDDEDFASMKMDAFCKEIKDSLESKDNKEPVRILRLWQEWWELKKVGPQGDAILEACLTKKYQGLKFYDMDKGNRVMTVKRMFFQKQ
mgnify:CR=1 FL=1